MRIAVFKPALFALILSLGVSGVFLSMARADEDSAFINGSPVSLDGAVAGADMDAQPQIGGSSAGLAGTHPHGHHHHAADNAYYPYDSSYYYPTTYMPVYAAPPVPPPIYVDENSGGYCRQFSQHVHVGNQVQESYGKACLQADGSWRERDNQ